MFFFFSFLEIITCVFILKQLFASGSVIISEYSPRLRLGEYSLIITSPSANKYGLLTKREVKMTGYWPSSFFACLWTETKSRSINTQKKNEANIQSS